jgi:choline dehydrogenase
VRSPHPLSKVFIQACVEAGIPYNADINGALQYGAGLLQATQKSGWRANTASAFLRPALAQGNVVLYTQAQVTRVLFEGRRAVGVEFRQGRELKQARAEAEVVLSGGSLISPQVLMHSGIGPAAALRHHGIAVLQDSPQVGSNLQEHFTAVVSAQVNVPTYNDENSWPKRILHGAHWLLRGRGPGATPGAQALAFFNTDGGSGRPDVQVHFTPVGFKLHGDHLEIFDKSSVILGPCVCRPRSRSRLALKSSDPMQPLAIHSRLIDDADDLRRLIAACRLMRRVTQTPSWAKYQVAEISPGPEVQTDDEWEAFIRQTAIPIYHPVGTCRMGSDADAVVDPRLRVNGVHGLRVVDASVMPIVPSGNTNAPTIMVAERAADLILEDRKNH